MKSPMIKMMERLSQVAEIIVQTILPKSFVDQLFKDVPEIKESISYIFCLEDFMQTEFYIIKDLRCLLTQDIENPR